MSTAAALTSSAAVFAAGKLHVYQVWCCATLQVHYDQYLVRVCITRYTAVHTYQAWLWKHGQERERDSRMVDETAVHRVRYSAPRKNTIGATNDISYHVHVLGLRSCVRIAYQVLLQYQYNTNIIRQQQRIWYLIKKDY